MTALEHRRFVADCLLRIATLAKGAPPRAATFLRQVQSAYRRKTDKGVRAVLQAILSREEKV